MDVSKITAPAVGQEPAVDITKLPADHRPKFLVEARRIFEHTKPPFVTTPGHATDGSTRSVFVTKNGQKPLLPIRTDLVAKHWGRLAHDGLYWTLDLNGERLIVTSFPNKGSVKGAKWVYCSWSGVGEDFEDLPLAFTCINGEYTSSLGPRTDTTAETHQPTASEITLTSATADGPRNDHPQNVTSLPEDHPVEYLDEAKALYPHSKPPFTILKTKKSRRRVFLAMQDGHYSTSSAKAEVVYRKWDSVNDYATLDLDGKRFIVSGNAGGHPGGYQYHLWLGSKVGRTKKVVAYSGRYAGVRKAVSGLTERLSDVDEDQNSSSSSSDDGRDQRPRAGPTAHQNYCYDAFIKAFDPTAIPLSTPSKFYTPQSIVPSETSARKERPCKTLKYAKRARSTTPPAHFGSKKGRSPARAPKRTSGRSRLASDDNSSDLSSLPYETPTPTPSVKDGPTPSSGSQEPQTQDPQVQAPASLPTLTLYKQTHTTLRATRDSNVIGFVPLRLLACMTMSTLFGSVVAASGHREYETPVKCLMAIFDWKEETDVYKTIYIDRGTEGSFEIFLEIIDEAPCWKDEGGRCGVAVEIVRA